VKLGNTAVTIAVIKHKTFIAALFIIIIIIPFLQCTDYRQKQEI